MAQSPLDPSNLISVITASADSLLSPLEAIAAFSHACMLAAGFRFIGFGEDHKAGTAFSSSCNSQNLNSTNLTSKNCGILSPLPIESFVMLILNHRLNLSSKYLEWEAEQL